MACERCVADPRPKNYGSDRRCAFGEDGAFNGAGQNWSCGTMDMLRDIGYGDHYGSAYVRYNDRSFMVLQVTPGESLYDAEREAPDGGYLWMSFYKDRGEVENAAILDWADSGLPSIERLTLGGAKVILARYNKCPPATT